MYGRILKKFVEQEFTALEIEEQAGFRTGLSTMDHVFSIRQLCNLRDCASMHSYKDFVMQKASNIFFMSTTEEFFFPINLKWPLTTVH